MNRFFFNSIILSLWAACSLACSSPPTLSQQLTDWCMNTTDVHSCIVLAHIKKRRQDHRHFRFYLDQACQKGHSPSCADTPHLVPSESIQQREVQKRRCEENIDEGCYTLATLYDKGIDGRKDFTKARSFYQHACQLKHAAACNNAGDMWAQGHGGKTNIATAEKYFRNSCTLNDGKGCANLALFEIWEGNWDSSRQLRKKACFLDEGASCAHLSWFWKWGWGTQPPNKYKAALYEKRACFLGHTPSCPKRRL